MKKIQIEKITIKENIRKDYGDLTELAASIRIHGLRNPVELNKENELVDGFRRVKAAKAAGLKDVPYFVNEEEVNKTEAQLISGIFQKNLNPIEEGKAFRKYIDETKCLIPVLAEKISKKIGYIDKRLVLVKLPSEVQKALIDKKILMGHALLLARLTKQDSLKFLREITREKHSVERAKDEITYHGFSAKLTNAKFNKTDCKNCVYNGSKQAELFETGKILNGACMNPKCFHNKVKQFVKQKREEFKDVLYEPASEYADPMGYVDGSHEWNCKDKGVTKKYMQKCRKEKYNYLVKIRKNGEITEYFKIPAKKKAKDGSVQASTDEEISEEKREQVLTSKVAEFKTAFLIKKSIELMEPGTQQVKALNVIKLIQSANWSDIDVISRDLGKLIQKGNGAANVKEMYSVKEYELDKAIELISGTALRKVDLKELILISRNFGVKIKKHFKITEDYLKIYTKDQLGDLIQEFDLDKTETDLKKGELIEHILKQNLKGKIPKIML